MSIHQVPGGYEVRWRQGTRQRSKKVDRRADAVAFETEIKRRKRLGTLADLDAGRELLADFGAEWFERSAYRRYAASTLTVYTHVWDNHILPRLGDYELRQLTTGLIEDELVHAMETAKVGRATQRKALLLLQTVVRYAVRRERLGRNPVEDVERPKVTRGTVQPIPLVAIERMLDQVAQRDGLLIQLMGYQGLRPGEALALTEAAVRERTLLVDSGVSLGEIGATKTRKARTVKLLPPVAADLAAYRLVTRRDRRAQRTRLLFPDPQGAPWSDTRWRNWRRRTFQPAIRDAMKLARKAKAPRPYHLRHTYVSLLIAEGRPIAEVAAQAGHSVEVCASTYTHLFEEYAGGDPQPAEDRIRAARAEATRSTG